MGAIPKLVRNAPRERLQEFLDAQECPLRERLRSFGPEDDYAGPLLKAVDELSDEEHARLTVNAERIDQMATEAGRTALLTGFPHETAPDRLLYDPQSNTLYGGRNTGGSPGRSRSSPVVARRVRCA